MSPTSRYVGWIASLSNGETVFEQPPVAGEKSSWQKLLDRLTAENLKMTGLQLQGNGLTLVCDYHKKVQGYCMAYEVLQIMFRNITKKMQGVGTIQNDLVFMTWIDDNGTVKQEIRPLSEMKAHSTLRDQHAGDSNSTPNPA